MVGSIRPRGQQRNSAITHAFRDIRPDVLPLAAYRVRMGQLWRPAVHLELKMPLVVEAVPKGCRNSRLVRLVDRVLADIPEYSLADTEIVVEAISQEPPAAEVRLLDGRLYRKIAVSRPDWLVAYHRFTPHDIRVVHTDPILYSNGRHPAISAPVVEEYRRSLVLDGHRAVEIDQLLQSERRGITPMTRLDFERTAKLLDAESVMRGVAMHKAMTDRLVAIDGQFWMESPPPAVIVELVQGAGVGIHPVNIRYGFVPVISDPTLTRAYFPLSQTEEAVAYAADLAGIHGSCGEARPAVPAFDAVATHFDPAPLEVHRIGLALTSEIAHQFFSRGRDFEGKNTTLFHAALEQARISNDVLGDRGDFTDLLVDLDALWNRMRQPCEKLDPADSAFIMQGPASCVVPMPHAARFAAYVDNQPISIHSL
jgi:hypothetical protein